MRQSQVLVGRHRHVDQLRPGQIEFAHQAHEVLAAALGQRYSRAVVGDPYAERAREGKVAIAIDEAGARATIRLRVDARALTLLSTGIVPLPEPVIERRAVVSLAVL